MLVVRDACDKRADNYKDGACLFCMVICVGCAMRPFSNAKEQFEADIFGVVSTGYVRQVSAQPACSVWRQ